MKMEKFNIVNQCRKTEKWYTDEVQGERININGLDCFIFEEIEDTEQGEVHWFNISDLKSGAKISHGLSREQAVEKATKIVDLSKYESAYKKQTGKVVGVKFPVNR